MAAKGGRFTFDEVKEVISGMGYEFTEKDIRVNTVLANAISEFTHDKLTLTEIFTAFDFLNDVLTGDRPDIICGIADVACLGYGAWELVFQALSQTFFETVVLWIKGGWRPSKLFSRASAKELYSFAWKIMIMSFIETISNQLRSIVIGKKYTSAELAFISTYSVLPPSCIRNVYAAADDSYKY